MLEKTNDITRELRSLRAKNGLTQEDAAKLLNISKTTYNYWENDPYNFKLSTLQKIFEAFGKPIEGILSDVEKTQ